MSELGRFFFKCIFLFVTHLLNCLLFVSCVVVTLYSTLGDEAVTHGINECEVSFVVTSFELLPKFKVVFYDCQLKQKLFLL